MTEHFFWITSRAAGISALLAASAAVALGLLMGGRMSKRKDLRVMHEALSLATLVALAVHALALLGDGYIKPSLADVTIPFLIDYRPFWTGRRDHRRLDAVPARCLVLLPRRGSAWRGGASCIAGRRWPGCSGSCTPSWPARTRARRGSCSPPAWSWFPAAALLVRRMTPAPQKVTA